MVILLFLWITRATTTRPPPGFDFSKQPVSTSVPHSTTVILDCVAGYQSYPVQYKWYRSPKVEIPPDQDNVLNSTESRIAIKIYKTDKKLLFQCSALSEGMTIFSNVARITISYFDFTLNSLEKYIYVNETLAAVATALSCNEQVNHVASNKPFQIVWYKKGRPISELRDDRVWMSPTTTEIAITVGSTEVTLLRVRPYDLVLYNLQVAEDEATYYCKAVQDKVELMLASWTVQVRKEFNSQPYFITEPVVGFITNSINNMGFLSNEITTDSSVFLFCGGVGFCGKENRLSYTWYNSSDVVSKSSKLVLEPGAVNEGRYHCTVRCGTDLVTKRATVVLPHPVTTLKKVIFTTEPPIYKGYILGTTLGDIDIPCSVQNDEQFRRTYYLNGAEISVPISVETASRLKSGVVQCSFQDRLTSSVWVQKSTQIVIIDRPRVIPTLPPTMAVGNTLHVFETESATFSFNISCRGLFRVNLTTDGVVNRVCEGGNGGLYNEMCVVKDNIYTITVNNFSLTNQRTYTMRVIHEFYKESLGGLKYNLYSYQDAASVKLVLVKDCGAELKVFPRLKVYSMGKHVTLTCAVIGHPEPNVMFYKDERPMGNWVSSCRTEVGRKTCSLTLTRYSDNGQYRCNAFSDIRAQRRFCNTTGYHVMFVGNPVIDRVTLHESPSDWETSEIVCTAEGNQAPDNVYWVANSTKKIEPKFKQSIGFHRTIIKMNITDTNRCLEFQCCVQELVNGRNYTDCKSVDPLEEPTEEIEEEASINLRKRQEKITMGLLIGGCILAVILGVVIFVCYRKRRQAKKALQEITVREGPTQHGNANAATQMVPKVKKAKEKPVKKGVQKKPVPSAYAELEFEPKTTTANTRKSRPRKPEANNSGQDHQPTYVKVRPVSNPRYASHC